MIRYTEEELVKIAKRENNSKRSYLIVNPLQGKHVPVSPNKAMTLFESLADILRNKYIGERVLLIGFAETATAIGAKTAVSLGKRYIQTTRETIPGVEYLFFSEEHSHAAEQKLVKDDIDHLAEETDRIIFVEDEITTGKTILNIIAVFDSMYHERFKFSVASLLNSMDDEHLSLYEKKGITLHYLVKTNHRLYGEAAERFEGNGNYFACNVSDNKENIREYKIEGLLDTRRIVDAKQYEKACGDLWDRLPLSISRLTGKKVLVLGTEEFMFPALFIGQKIENNGNDVRCHSTTRSPIAVSMEEEYPLCDRYELKSLYDSERKTFLYNIEAYDTVLIVTDAPASEKKGLFSLINALKMKNSNISVIRWC